MMKKRDLWEISKKGTEKEVRMYKKKQIRIEDQTQPVSTTSPVFLTCIDLAADRPHTIVASSSPSNLRYTLLMYLLSFQFWRTPL